MQQHLTRIRTYVKMNQIYNKMMVKVLTATQFRSQIYTTLDQIIQTGEPIWIQKSGKKFKVTLEKPEIKDKFSRLVTHKTIIGDPDDLVNIKVGEWHELENL